MERFPRIGAALVFAAISIAALSERMHASAHSSPIASRPDPDGALMCEAATDSNEKVFFAGCGGFFY